MMRNRKNILAAVFFLLQGVFLPGFAVGEERVDIIIDGNTFTALDYPQNKLERSMRYTWRGCSAEDVMSRLNKIRPDDILSVPKFEGAEQLYGYLELGNFENNRFYFAIDVISLPRTMKMYFDLNKNGRLDDDGPPLENGGGFKPEDIGYATKLEIPWKNLIVNAPFKGKFKAWFFINDFQWSIRGHSHYSHTFLKGSAVLNGVKRVVYIRDTAENDNDADFTNDGLYLQTGPETLMKISAKQAREGVEIDGVVYTFTISWKG